MEISPLDRVHRQAAENRHRQDPAVSPAGDAVAALFVHTRRLTFGDTDSARIVYTPRVMHFAVEAVEAWLLERLGISWLHLVRDQHMGTPCVHADVDFLSPMTPPDLLHTEVALVKVGRSSLSFRLAGRIDGRLCWRANYVFAFVSDATGRSVPVPECYHAAIAQELALGAAVA